MGKKGRSFRLKAFALLLTVLSANMLVFLVLASVGTLQQGQSGNLTLGENEVLALVNGTRAYECELEMEKIGLNHSVSGFSFRSSGSSGASETARYVMERFESFGLETRSESFEFTSWALPTEPVLMIDDDGDPATSGDQVQVSSFQSAHYSWPTPLGGVFRDLVVLPLPPAASRSEIGLYPIDMNAWNAINIAGKILLIGREVTWSSSWHQIYLNKLSSQPPAAIVLTWWYDWMSFTPMDYSSSGGRPITGYGPYYWNLQIPVGGVDYQDGLWIRNRENSLDVSASLRIEAVVSSGPHYNVVGILRGTAVPERFVYVCGHYDTVTVAGFCDNGAGTAGVVELANVLTDAVNSGLYQPKYSVVFVAFAGEELGLVGSVHYVGQHKVEMPSIVAVINLDCIGSDNLLVSETVPSASGLDLDEVVLQAAADLGVSAALTGTGGSDQESFRDPVGASWYSKYHWGIDPGVGDADPVEAATMLVSEPLYYDDMWHIGTPGWIHTSYDNSTSTQNLGWVEIADFEDQLRVALLSVVRVSPSMPHPFHDLVITNIVSSKTVVGQGFTVQITVTVRNVGDFFESFNVTVYADLVMIEKKEASLPSQSVAYVVFSWNTLGWGKKTWGVSAYVEPVQSEADTENNTFGNGVVAVVTPGDVTANGVVDILDTSRLSAHWYPGPPTGSLGYDSNYDINGDGEIDVVDLGIVSAHWTGPPKGPLAP